MRRFNRVLLIAGLACLLISPAYADMTLRIHDSIGSGPGGEFLVQPEAGWFFTPASHDTYSPFQFETLCIEADEYFTPGQLYYAELNTGAVFGDGGGDGSFDPISEQTAYLYSNFIDGTLADYSYGSGRLASADALQDVVWYLEGEKGLTWTLGDGSLRDKFYQDAMANAEAGNFYDVRVLNVWENYDPVNDEYYGAAQDQLVKIPAPGAALLGVFGLGLVSRIKRSLSA